MKRALALAIVSAACAPQTVTAGGDAASAAASSAPAPPPTAPAATDAGADAEAPHGDGSIADVLEHGRLVALAPSGRGASFDATLSLGGAGAEPVRARADVASIAAPRAYRRALALYRLARALGSEVVPAVVVRPIALGELAKLLGARAEAREALRSRAVVQNDGTLDVMLRPLAPADGREISFDGFEATTWARWAASPEPAAGEDAAVLRSWVEALVLDYLSGNVLRRTAWLEDRTGALRLVESPLAFPLHTDAGALDRTLRQLREVTRFPKGLDDALRRLDRPGARALFCPGEFETWLLPPRSLVELDERRLGLLTLIEARATERGTAAVLSL